MCGINDFVLINQLSHVQCLQKNLIAHYWDTMSNTFFSQLINLKQKGSMVEHTEDFQRLNIKVNDILEEHILMTSLGI